MEFVNSIKNKNIKELKLFFSDIEDYKLIELRKILDDSYYNDEKSLVDDKDYDIFYEYLIERIPSERYKIGSKLRDFSNKSKLPYWMGSLDKKKDDKTIFKWVEKYSGPYFITEKLDGVSLMIQYNNGKIYMYTRGDGQYGSDISYFQNYINIPKNISNISIRGELIVSKDNFKKYAKNFDNPRQMVSGIVNAKTLKAGIQVIDFVGYEILDTDEKISDQIKILEKLKFNVPIYENILKLDKTILSEKLIEFKSASKYCIDGIVVRDDSKYKINNSGNPDYSFAFKMMGELFKTRVEDVIWDISKTCVLKPTIKLEPVNVGDVVISYTSGFNGKYIVNNGIGRGAIVEITRSGDVIPYIVNILKKEEPILPKTPYMWNETKVDLIAVSDFYKDSFLKRYLSELFTCLGILNLGKSTIDKLYDNGYDTFEKILNCKKDSFKHIEGLGEKSSQKIYESLRDGIENITECKLLASTNVLGNGISEKKISLILEKYPTIFKEDKNYSFEEYKTMIKNIHGFSDKTAIKIAENINWAKKFIKKFGYLIKTSETKVFSNKLEKLKVVFSGFRDKELEEKVKLGGGDILSGISKKTTHLIVKELDGNSSKIKKARELGIQILKIEKFIDIINELSN